MYGLSSTLTFLERQDRFSVFTQPDGTLVRLEHGTARVLISLADVDVARLWRDVYLYPWNWNPSRLKFAEALAAKVWEDDPMDHVAWCPSCLSPGLQDDMTEVQDEYVCGTCIRSYRECDSCEELCGHYSSTMGGSVVCQGCLDTGYFYCDDCDGYVCSDDASGHRHGDCDCEAPARVFTLRNDGEALLRSDIEVTVTLPAGTISAEGVGTISRHLREVAYNRTDPVERDHMYNLSYDLEPLGDTWQTKDGNYAKRLSRHAYKNYSLKLSPEDMSRVGCIARDHSTAVDFRVAITRNLNLPPEEFAHEDSCWWGSYGNSRCALKSNGGFGLRTFDGEYGDVSGRAWVMPLRQDDDGALHPTFDTENPDAFVVFNGYGKLGGYTPARILSHMAGMTYRKIYFTCSPMYVNNEVGYLVAPEELASRYTDGTLRLSVNTHSNLFLTEEASRKVLTNA